MTSREKKRLRAHAEHEVHIVDYKIGEPVSDESGRFCLECLDCEKIILGDRTMVGAAKAISVEIAL
ncbi:hypothetical protein LCGC14_1377910 [marine sediment metagenome]|uniref:Uncharacterized protein n=1 Tax=marine sediment metagenome TaxID=412755 RepID=A0A0F9N5A5_9ZZZZ